MPDGFSGRRPRAGRDPDTDIALVRANGSPASFAPLAYLRQLRRCQIAIAIGNPLGYEWTVTAGVCFGARPLHARWQRPADSTM